MHRTWILWLSMLLTCGSVAAQQAPQRVWIDTDIIFDKFRRDVDDGLALMLAWQAPQLDIVGQSLVINVAHGEAVTRRLMGYLRPDDPLPLYRGADDASQRGQLTPAVVAMAAALQEGSLTLIALGPATNVATLLQHYPQLADSIERIVFCAGRRPGSHFQVGDSERYLPDYNVEKDPEAFRQVLASKVPLLMAGFEPASDIYLSRQDLKPLKQNRHPGDRWIWRQLKDWLFAWRVAFGSKAGFIPFDTATMGAVVAPQYFEVRRDVPIALTTGPNDCRMVIDADTKPYLVVGPEVQSARTCDYVTDTQASYQAFLLAYLLRTHPE